MSRLNIVNSKKHFKHMCTTLGDLLDSFDVKLNYFMNDKKRSFPISASRDDVLFHRYDLLDFYENKIHMFTGLKNYRTVRVLLDIRHQLIYSTAISEDVLTVSEYTLDGDFVKSYELECSNDNTECLSSCLKRDYLCYNIKDLIDAFNLDIKLSDELNNHIIVCKENEECEYCCGNRILFSDYYIKVISGTELYVFESMFDNDTIILDSEAPVYYIDPEKQHVYMETKGMVGICILKFNKNNEIVEDAHSWIVDMEMFLKLNHSD